MYCWLPRQNNQNSEEVEYRETIFGVTNNRILNTYSMQIEYEGSTNEFWFDMQAMAGASITSISVDKNMYDRHYTM